jgi:uncharacterized protein YyaL (SSP411 family)
VNRLAGATSPYLRQHADNPVDWYPWGDEAFERARRDDKPLFVSVGYAACHWCHVMAHESFEDPGVAEDLSSGFVSVKVDREERPDVDAVYMSAVQAMTGSGGWPMSVFCTPDGRPFFAGTYFPPSERAGMPSFRRVLAAVLTAWRDRRDEVESQADALASAVADEARTLDRLGVPAGSGATTAAAPAPPSAQVLARGVRELAATFDPRWGGFGSAPKFPRAALVELCLRHHLRAGDEEALSMATTTLDAMAAGGIYDHLEGGFARYSTDARWLVPHFEKMLTDQALLARAYLRAWQVTGRADYRQVAAETIEAVLTAMAVPGGGFCSSIDADAAGVEGGHATWSPDEVHAALEDAGLPGLEAEVRAWYGVGAGAAHLDGRFVLHRPLRAPLERPPAVEAGCAALLAARLRRPQPQRDDKVLTEWNAMFIATLAEAAGACDDARWGQAAQDAATALLAHNRREDGRWLRAAHGDVPAFAADHAWLVECFLRLGELTGLAAWTVHAAAVADTLLDLFWDAERGGLFTTGHDAERLIVRTKDVLDGAVPSANAVGASALLRLGALTGERRFEDAGRRLVELVAPLLVRQPTAVADAVPACALLDDGAQVVVAGARPDLLAVVRAAWLPDAVLSWGDAPSGALWEGRAAGAAYVCRGFVCDVPAPDPATLESQLVHLGARPRR